MSNSVATEKVLQRLEQVTKTLESLAEKIKGGGKGAKTTDNDSSTDSGEESPAKKSQDTFQSKYVDIFTKTAENLNLNEMSKMVKTGFDNIGNLIATTKNFKKPTIEELKSFIAPTSEAITEAQKILSKQHKNDDHFNHWSAIVEILMSLSWAVDNALPQGFIQDQLESADFYLSKVLMRLTKGDFTAEVKKSNRDFVNQSKEMLKEMKAFVKQWFATGLEQRGQSPFKNYQSGGAPTAPKAPSIAVAAAPPPSTTPSTSAGGGGGFGAVLQSINKGSKITSGLKKVTADMKSKNRPASEKSGLVKATGSAAKTAKPKPAASKPAKVYEPTIYLSRDCHFIEHWQEGECKVPESATIKQSVSIFNCGEMVVRVPEKVKAVGINNCKKTSIVLGSVVSTVEIVNCKSVKVYVTGLVNAVSIDKTEGCQLVIHHKESLKMDLVTSNISEVNIQVPGDNEKDDMIELSVPEQFVTVIKGSGKKSTLETQHVKHG